jgi:hypothetical protein
MPQRQAMLDLLPAPRFADQALAETNGALLDAGIYHCSIRALYRLLGQNGEIRERRQQLRHPVSESRGYWQNPMKSGRGHHQADGPEKSRCATTSLLRLLGLVCTISSYTRW